MRAGWPRAIVFPIRLIRAALLVLSLAVAALGIRSLFKWDHVYAHKWSTEGEKIVSLEAGAYSGEGRIGLWIYKRWNFQRHFRPAPPQTGPTDWAIAFEPRPWSMGSRWSMVPRAPRWPVHIEEKIFECGYDCDTFESQNQLMAGLSFRYDLGEYEMRHWFLALLLGAWPGTAIAVRLVRWRRNRRLGREGLCRVCGYDLRATPERCPECGTAVLAKDR